MTPRRGVALLAALWLVVAIAAVALQFSLEAHERRTVGILASERGQQRALATGALALMRARMDQALRLAPTGNNVAILRASDPWLDVDSSFSGPVLVDSMEVDVVAHDLGEKLNINTLNENEIRTFFSFLLGDFTKATQLSQTILDWRDTDTIPRPSGAERDAYIKEERLALPTNSQFRELEDLQNVMGMTPEIYAQAAPYLTIRGSGQVNVNVAPVPVLRALPGMTDATLNRILMLRSQGRRIRDASEIFPTLQQQQQQGRGGRPIAGQVTSQALITQFQARIATTTNDVELTFTARVGPQAQPTKLTAWVRRAGNGPNSSTVIQYQQW